MGKRDKKVPGCSASMDKDNQNKTENEGLFSVSDSIKEKLLSLVIIYFPVSTWFLDVITNFVRC